MHGRHAGPPKPPFLAMPKGGTVLIASILLAAGVSASIAMGSDAAIDRAAQEDSRILSSNIMQDGMTTVSRGSARKPLNGASKLARPDPGPGPVRAARSELSAVIAEAAKLHGDSAGKVADENTRITLDASIGRARTLMARSTLKSERSGLDGERDSLRAGMDAVRASMETKSNADAKAAADAEKAAQEERRAAEGQARTPSRQQPPSHRAPAGEIQQYARQAMGRYGWGDDQWDSLDFIVTHESGWNPSAMNPSSGAKGLFQCLGHADCNTPTYMSDYREQVDWGLRYIARRYGSPNSAADYWHAHGSY